MVLQPNSMVADQKASGNEMHYIMRHTDENVLAEE